MATLNQNIKVSALSELQNFGLFQKIQFFLVLLPVVFVLNCNYIFVAEDIHHR